MEQLVHEIAMLAKAVHDAKATIAEKEDRLKEAIALLAAESCTTDKRMELPTGYGRVVLTARDNKVFPEDVQLQIARLEDAHKATIAPSKAAMESEKAAVKLAAEKAGKMAIDRRWYVKEVHVTDG